MKPLEWNPPQVRFRMWKPPREMSVPKSEGECETFTQVRATVSVWNHNQVRFRGETRSELRMWNTLQTRVERDKSFSNEISVKSSLSQVSASLIVYRGCNLLFALSFVSGSGDLLYRLYRGVATCFIVYIGELQLAVSFKNRELQLAVLFMR